MFLNFPSMYLFPIHLKIPSKTTFMST
jgi:hypothetical protein